MKELSKEDYKELASQLRNPSGENGTEMGHVMNETNMTMTKETISNLSLVDNDIVLELGHGNGHHIKDVLTQATSLSYIGLDISPLMKQESEKFCQKNKLINQTTFHLYDGKKIPLASNSVDKIFTVNTIYFWDEPDYLLNEIFRILKENGKCYITFVTEESMKNLPFTEFGFTKYNESKFISFIEKSDFKLANIQTKSETINSKLGTLVQRDFIIGQLEKI